MANALAYVFVRGRLANIRAHGVSPSLPQPLRLREGRRKGIQSRHSLPLPQAGGGWGEGWSLTETVACGPTLPPTQLQVNDAPHRLGHAGGMTDLKLACGRGVDRVRYPAPSRHGPWDRTAHSARTAQPPPATATRSSRRAGRPSPAHSRTLHRPQPRPPAASPATRRAPTSPPAPRSPPVPAPSRSAARPGYWR